VPEVCAAHAVPFHFRIVPLRPAAQTLLLPLPHTPSSFTVVPEVWGTQLPALTGDDSSSPARKSPVTAALILRIPVAAGSRTEAASRAEREIHEDTSRENPAAQRRVGEAVADIMIG